MNTYQTQMMLLSRYVRNAMLGALKTRPGAALWVTPKVRLSKDPAFNPIVGQSAADLATGEADYSGYVTGGIEPVLSDPLNLSPSVQGVMASSLFEATTAAPFVPNTVYGYWLDDGTNVIGGERFAGGQVAELAQAGDFVQIDVAVPLTSIQPSA